MDNEEQSISSSVIPFIGTSTNVPIFSGVSQMDNTESVTKTNDTVQVLSM